MKKLIAITGLAAMLFMTGCANKQTEVQPQAQAQETNAQQPTAQTTKVQSDSALAGNETVNTANANVESKTIATNNENANNQKFAKKLAEIVVYFDFDKYNIRPDQWGKVEKLANLIKQNPANYTVRIEGNCDEWGTEEYNYALGLKRANTVKKALIKLGVDPKKLTVISYGELNPVCTAHARWCWRKNRRDNFTYLP